MHIYLHLDDDITPGSRTVERILWLKVFFRILRYNASFQRV